MKLSAAAYSAETVASAAKAGSYGVFGERESNLGSLLSTHHSAWKSNTLLVAASFYATRHYNVFTSFI
jgi:hypothetical protein